MNLREMLDHIAEIHITQGGEIPVMSEEGDDLVGVEYNDDEEPCVLLIFEDSGPDILTLSDVTKREP
jgi:hypothetical protein